MKKIAHIYLRHHPTHLLKESPTNSKDDLLFPLVILAAEQVHQTQALVRTQEKKSRKVK